MPAGGPRRLEATAFDARWSPDGTLLAYVLGPDLFLADSEGRSPRQIVSVPESILGRPVWSPDQASLRFTSSSNEGAPTIWEVRADGTGLRRVFREMAEPHESGAWTPDGRYFLYDARRNDTWDLWVTRERLRAFEKAGRGPFRLTTGPLSYRSPIFSRDGKRLFAIGEQKRGELVRFDERSGVFVPFLGGISADSLAWSPDGKWIAYISYPDSSLWRCAADGSSRLQLTRPPARAILPHWSPDSTEIAFSEQSVGGPHAIHTVSRDGGPLHRVLPENRPQLDADWSADGKSILFGRAPGIEHASSDQFTIQMVNLASGVVSVIPGSEGLAYPHFSPDRRYIAALSTDEKDLKLFDFETKKWRTLTSFNANYPAWTKDSRYLSFDTMFGSQPAIIRIDVQTGRFERTVTLKNVARTGTFGLWSGLSPEGSPLILRDVGTQEIYALDLLLP
jgi:Tol biopolymer transport system component